MTQAVFAAGLPAPEVFGEVTLEGRFGVVLQRLDGPTLLHLSRSGAMTPEQTGAVLATLAISVHRDAPAAGRILSARHDGGRLRRGSRQHASEAHRHWHPRPDRAPGAPADGLCHGDLYPGNVIMTADGPRLVDWTFSIRAPAALDHGLHSHQPDRVCPRRHRQSAAAACGQCGSAIRIRASVRRSR